MNPSSSQNGDMFCVHVCVRVYMDRHTCVCVGSYGPTHMDQLAKPLKEGMQGGYNTRLLLIKRK